MNDLRSAVYERDFPAIAAAIDAAPVRAVAESYVEDHMGVPVSAVYLVGRNRWRDAVLRRWDEPESAAFILSAAQSVMPAVSARLLASMVEGHLMVAADKMLEHIMATPERHRRSAGAIVHQSTGLTIVVRRSTAEGWSRKCGVVQAMVILPRLGGFRWVRQGLPGFAEAGDSNSGATATLLAQRCGVPVAGSSLRAGATPVWSGADWVGRHAAALAPRRSPMETHDQGVLL